MIRHLIRQLLVKLGYAPLWFTVREFDQRVGRLPCVDCVRNNENRPVDEPPLYCEYDIDAWFDAVMA